MNLERKATFRPNFGINICTNIISAPSVIYIKNYVIKNEALKFIKGLNEPEKVIESNILYFFQKITQNRPLALFSEKT